MSEVGGPKVGLMNIGEEAKPPFAVLPDPVSVFLNRSKRFAALAPGHELEPYLQFLARLTRIQHDVQEGLPAASLPPFDRIAQALEHGMPPLSRALYEPDALMELTVERLLSQLASVQLPQATALAVSAAQQASPAERRAMVAAALKDASPPEDMAQRTLVLAGLQVHFARLAALLGADDLKPIADGVCPACGSAPVSSTVVGWPKAHNTRFCTCSLCATMWNVVRVKCVLCSSTEGISLQVDRRQVGAHQGRNLRQVPALREDPLPGQRSRTRGACRRCRLAGPRHDAVRRGLDARRAEPVPAGLLV